MGKTKGCKMNDRFKFRVWNNKHNRYIVDSHYPIGSDHIIVIKQDGKAYNLSLGDYEDYSNMHSWAVIEEFTDCILEQCTGLKDKNGNLIYEGDIILGRKELVVCEMIEYKDVVEYKDGQYFPFNCTGIYKPEKFEIVGNIHEQAEQKDN